MDNKLIPLNYAQQVSELFLEIDSVQAEFSSAAGISCLPGCGKCCNNPEIEISPLETYPWVMHIIQSGQAEEYLERLHSQQNKICLFYRHNPDNPDYGSCGNYRFRPLLCRLFGCSMLPDKFGNLRPVLCKLVKQSDPKLEPRIARLTAQGINAPVFSAYYTRLSTIDPFYGSMREPINQAFYNTLLKMSYLEQLTQ